MAHQPRHNADGRIAAISATPRNARRDGDGVAKDDSAPAKSNVLPEVLPSSLPVSAAKADSSTGPQDAGLRPNAASNGPAHSARAVSAARAAYPRLGDGGIMGDPLIARPKPKTNAATDTGAGPRKIDEKVARLGTLTTRVGSPQDIHGAPPAGNVTPLAGRRAMPMLPKLRFHDDHAHDAAAEIALTRFGIRYLDHRNQEVDTFRRVPALDVFRDAVSAFSRGAPIPTSRGEMAVEDLYPGLEIMTSEGDLLPIQWIGSRLLAAPSSASSASNAHPFAAHSGADSDTLYRVMADGFGLARPAQDITLGPAARCLQHTPHLRNRLGLDHALAPISAMADGQSVVPIRPMGQVEVFHIALSQHRLIPIAGLEFETFHPGPQAMSHLSGPQRGAYMAMFPHLSTFGDFGAMKLTRLAGQELRQSYLN